jgi:hypothetical protein
MDQGVILNFKAHYLHLRFKQIVGKTDGEDKQSIRQFSKDDIFMNCQYIRATWNEETPNCLNTGWRKLRPQACSNLEEDGEETVIQNIVKLASEARLEGVNEDDVQELLQSHGESLTNDKLRGFTEQCIQSELTASDAEEVTPVREIFTEFLSNSITAITQTMDQLTDNGLDYKQSSKARQGILDMVSCY